MELMYPIAIIICLIVALVICFKKFNKGVKYTNGKKIANTKYIKETEYYKAILKKYKILSNTIKILSVACIITISILIARPVTVQTKSEDRYNRDILLGLDISTSQCEVNVALINKFEEIIPSIEGDRIGIVLFNTAPVVYCPLTDDYDYVNECFETIKEQLEIVIENDNHAPPTYEVDGVEMPTIWYGGVRANSAQRGSSLVGDGLAGTVFSFPDLKTDSERTRIIIFATDNDVAGTEEVSLEEASMLCNQYNINLYAYCPTTKMNIYATQENIASYKSAIEKAGGKFYTGDLEQMTSNIVNEIKETKTSLLKTSKKTYVTDHPEIIFIIAVILFFILIIIEKRIRL